MLLLLLALFGCTPEVPIDEAPALQAGAPVAGAAEGTLDLPVGTPMGGYSARCVCLTGQGKQDSRDSAYSRSFVETTGVHMRPAIKVIWLENGDEHLVIAKADVIYSYDALVVRIRELLEQRTGLDLEGRVVLHASHSHSSYGPFSDQIHFYLGGDYYNEEVFQSFADQVAGVAMQAFDTREPAAIGTGWAKDWDPDDRIYRDRRGENNHLDVWGDGTYAGKDPYLNVLRVDAVDGDPIAMMFTFGIHGISLPITNSLLSGDSSAGLEVGVQEAFDEPVVVMHAQGNGGDASPAGVDSSYAKVESLGLLARAPIMELYDATPTSSDPLYLETASRSIWQHHSQIHVTRDGAVDWYYKPYEEGYLPDNQVYDENGEILSPIDEFNAPFGAAFCGDGDFDIPVGGIGADVFPYKACMDVETVSQLLYGFFDLEEGSIPLPMPSSFKAGTTASRIGPLPVRDADGTEATRDLLVGYFPGEPLYLFGEQWRRRVAAETPFEMPLLVGYAQDHEGYLLIPEDWLTGGYEPNIALWGPLQGEHIMEGVLEYSDGILGTDVREDPNPHGWFDPVEYPDRPLPEIEPDTTPDAGTRIFEPPEAYFWLPDGFEADFAETPAEVPRVYGQVQLAWIGGDPAVDMPAIILERQVEGAWQPVMTGSGRPVTDTFQDILLGHTPLPLYPASGDQTHYWWAVWQAAAHDGDRRGLPAGTYRLHVQGDRYVGGNTTWPWDTEPYELIGDPFEVVPATLDVSPGDDGLWVSVRAPANGWRLIDLEGRSTGDNPIRGLTTIELTVPGSPTTTLELEPAQIANGRAWFDVNLAEVSEVVVTDPHGNTGTWTP